MSAENIYGEKACSAARQISKYADDVSYEAWQAAAKAAIAEYLRRNGQPVVIVEPTYNDQAMGCGLEDRNITDRYEAMLHGWDCAIRRMFEQIPEGKLYVFHIPLPSEKKMADARAVAIVVQDLMKRDTPNE